MPFLASAGLAWGAAAAAAAWVRHAGALPGDRRMVAAWGYPRFGLTRWERPTEAFGRAGGPAGAAVTTVVAGAIAVLTTDRDRRAVAGVAALAPLAALIARCLAAVVGPTALGRGAFGPQSPPNFPSRHVAWITALGVQLAAERLRAGRRGGALLAAVPVVAIGPERVLSRAHLPGDVVGGYLVGGGWGLASAAAVAHLRR